MGDVRSRLRVAYRLAAELLAIFGMDGPAIIRKDDTIDPLWSIDRQAATRLPGRPVPGPTSRSNLTERTSAAVGGRDSGSEGSLPATVTRQSCPKAGVASLAMSRLPPYWRPTSEADIERAIRDDLLCESHTLDCKREIGSKADRKETARDLASFAIDSGALLVGVEEDKANRIFSLAPQPLSGLAERVEDIAWSIIDPGLDVLPHEIESASGQGLGYLFVEVRPSPFVLHMVDGAYYGRGEKRRVRLTDPQVRRYLTQRQSVEGQIDELLDQEIARDPLTRIAPLRGHLYLMAQPLTAPVAVARRLVRQIYPSALSEIVQEAESRLAGSDVVQADPHVREANVFQRRAYGAALCSYPASGPGRTIRGNKDSQLEEHYVDIEFREDGGIRALVGRVTYYENVNGVDRRPLHDWLIVAYAVRLIGWAAAMGRRVGYHGSWGLGLHISRLRGLQGFIATRNTFDSPAFSEEVHRATAIATLADLDEKGPDVAGELVGGLLCAVGTPQQAFADLVSL